MSRFIRKHTIVLAAVSLVGLPLAAILLQYAELRWTAKHYTISGATASTLERSLKDQSVLPIVFLNTHLLPLRIEKIAGNRSDGLYRVEQIARELADYDIVGLCEVFDPKCLRALVDSLQKQSGNAFHVVSSPLPPSIYMLGGGCLLLSRHPIESTEVITFKDSSTFWSHGVFADGFAAKGAILARIRLPGPRSSHTVLNCVVTHLEARSQECRVKQIGELADFLRGYTGGHPTIVMGDLNTPAEDDEDYIRLRDALKLDDARLRDAWEDLNVSGGGTSDPLANDGGDRIDYLLYAPGRGEHRIRISDVNVRQLRNDRVGSLSDHAAVEGTFIVGKATEEK